MLGYDKAASIPRHARERGITAREAAIEPGLLSGEAFDRLVDPKRLTKGGR